MAVSTMTRLCECCKNERVIRDPFGPGLVPCPRCNGDSAASKLTRLYAERDRLEEAVHAITCAIGDAIADRDAEEFFPEDSEEPPL